MWQAGKALLQYQCGLDAPGAAVLGQVCYGVGEAPPDADLCVPMAVVGAGTVQATRWLSLAPFREGEYLGCRYRANDHFLFGAIRLAETDFEPSADATALQLASRAAYDRLFAVLAAADFPQLVRCWNYLPSINLECAGMERYRQFNIGRQEAFIAAGRSCFEGLPAASALGTAEGDLFLYFLAARAKPQAIENPRQLSAFRYPEQYGPRSPSFARASLLPLPGSEVLFVSGTASIVGHESVHLGDIAAQTAETLVNIEAVLKEANRLTTRGCLTSASLDFKVFLRHPADHPVVAEVLRQHLGQAPRALYLQADICRSELLVEIEAVGIQGAA